MEKKIKYVKMGVHVQLGELHYYEIKYYWDNEEGQERCNILEVPAKPLKEKGVIKRTNSYKKIIDWINDAEDGRVFFLNGLRLKFGKGAKFSFVA